MPVDIEQWCAEIGNFNGHFHGIIMKLELNLFNIISSLSQVLVFIFALLFQYISNVDTAFYFLTKFCVFSLLTVVLKFTVHSIFFIKILNVLYSSYFLHLLLLQHGNIESNPGPKKEQIKYLTCCHWNVNSLLGQNMCKISQIEAYNSLYNYDFICISETYFDLSTLEGDRNFQLNGYHLIRADDPSNTKRGGVCIYRKESLGVRLVKFSNLSVIVEPLSIIFSNCINQSLFPDIWKKSNICPIHKKGDKQIIKNYRPVSLLPICGKIFERIIFNSLYEYVGENKLLSVHQSGFRCNDSCVNQLLSIVHNLYKAFDAYPTLETRGVFLDMSKAFDKVLHQALIFKLKSVGFQILY